MLRYSNHATNAITRYRLTELGAKLNVSEARNAVTEADVLSKQRVVDSLTAKCVYCFNTLLSLFSQCWTRLSILEAEEQERGKELQRLQEQIGESTVTAEWLKAENERLQSERNNVEKQAGRTLDELTELRKELESRTEK